MRNIALFTSNRAERGLLEPIFNALKGAGLDPWWFDITASSRPYGSQLSLGLQATEEFIRSNAFEMALVPCDRPEMVGAALALFYHNVAFAQFHAGDVGSGVHDEVGRWIIGRCASLHFCNSPESAWNLIQMGEEPWRVHVVGSTALDGVEIDQSLCPEVPFDLLLVHPDTFSAENTQKDIETALSLLDKYTVAIGPNGDTYYGIIVQALINYHYQSGAQTYEFRASVPRPQFLGLIKNCKRFITNSSSALYELPAFGIQKWVNIGLRNADRKPLEKIDQGASKRIAEILKTLELDDRLLRKHFTMPKVNS